MNSKTLIKWLVSMDNVVKIESVIEVWTTLLCWRKICFWTIGFQNLQEVLDRNAGYQDDPEAELCCGDFTWQ